MFASISRQSSRVTPPYFCSSCLSGLLAQSDVSAATQSHRALNRSIKSFSTTRSNIKETETNEDGESKDKSANTYSKARGVKGVGSNSRKALDALRRSLKLADSKAKLKNGEGKTSARQRNKPATKKTAIQKPSKPKTPAPTEESTAAQKLVTRVSTRSRNSAAKTENTDSSLPSGNGDGQKPRKLIKRVKIKTGKARCQSLIGQLDTPPARKALVKLIQSGGLSAMDKSEAMRQLRASLIYKYRKDGLPGSRSVLELGVDKPEIQSAEAPQQSNHPGQAPKARKSKPETSVSKILAPRIRPVQSSNRVSARKPPARGRRLGGPRQVNIRTGPMQQKPGFEIQSVDAESLELVPLQIEQPPVPGLSYGLERVLFNPGVYQLQDPRSRVFNFDPYLRSITPVNEFDFNALKQYVTSSRDKSLLKHAADEKKKYTGSTSSMTGALAHFHFLLSQWRPINTGMLSRDFPVEFNSFTALQRGPSAIFLRWRDGTYAIDADKEYDNANILSMLGKSMEKLLTLPTEEYEKYHKANSDQISEEERNESESFHYTTMGDFLMRSQLDAYDARLPGTGMFDLKTRAVVSIRMDIDEYKQGRGYEIRGRHGAWESYEREYYDLIRAAFLKYSLQARMGRMDGIFVAYHNTQRIFGFQYISLAEMDYALHGTGDTTLGDSEFKLSLELLNKALDRATAKFPKQSLRIHFEARGSLETPFMYIFAEPVTEEEIQKIQESNKEKIEEFEKEVLGLHASKPTKLEEKKNAEWEILRSKVEEALEIDAIGMQNARAVAVSLLEENEILDLSPEEVEERVEELLSAAMNENADEEEEDLAEKDEEQDDDNEVESSAADQNEEDEAEEDEEEVEEEELSEDVEDEKIESEADEEFKDLVEGPGLVEKEDGIMEDTKESAQYHSQVSGEKETQDEFLEDETTPEDSEATENPSSSKDEVTLPNESPKPNTSETNEAGDHLPLRIRRLGGPQESKAEPSEHKLFCATLTIRNKVNDEYVVRPDKISSTDKWTVEYALSEIPPDIKAETLLDACKLRRRKALTRQKEEVDLDQELNEWELRNLNYIENLKMLSEKGRKYRKEQDEIDAQGPLKTL